MRIHTVTESGSILNTTRAGSREREPSTDDRTCDVPHNMTDDHLFGLTTPPSSPWMAYTNLHIHPWVTCFSWAWHYRVVAWALSLVDGRWGWRGGGCRERQASSAPPSVAAHTKRERPLPTETQTETPQTRAVATPDTPKYSNPIGRMISLRISHVPPLLAAYASHGVVRVHRCISRGASIRLAGPDSLGEFRVFRPERLRFR